MDADTFPPVSEALLKALRDHFPDRCPDTNVPLEEVRAKAGEQRVIALLAEVLRLQNEENNVLQRKDT